MCFKMPFLRWQKTTLSFSHTPSLAPSLSASLALSLSGYMCWRPYGQILWRWDLRNLLIHTHTHSCAARAHIHTPPQSFVYERPWWWNLFSDGSILKHMNGNISMILLSIFPSLCISICGYTQTHTHTHTHTNSPPTYRKLAHTPGAAPLLVSRKHLFWLLHKLQAPSVLLSVPLF